VYPRRKASIKKDYRKMAKDDANITDRSIETAAPKTRAKQAGQLARTTDTRIKKDSLTIAEEIEALADPDPDFVAALARGLAVMRAFSDQRRMLTIAQISHKTGISRASVRRCLHTLKVLGYVEGEEHNFSLKPRVLTLGYSYLSSTPLMLSAQPCLNSLSRTLNNESISLAMFDNNEVLYIARSATARIMSVPLSMGTRLPAYCTSLGRVMLSHLSNEALKNYFDTVKLRAYTQSTLVSRQRLMKILVNVRQAGYSIVQEELEPGQRSIGVPVRGVSGTVWAALSILVQDTRVTTRQMEEEFLPVLVKGSHELSVLLP
jgi:IclR family pca regulon transcriptional regulator